MRNLERLWLTARCIAGAIAAGGLIGCSTTGYKKAETVADSVQTASRSIQAESRGLNHAMEKLGDLVDHPSADLKPQFKSFSKAMDQLTASCDRANHSGQKMQENTAAYFKAWDEQLAAMKYDAIRAQSESRKTTVSYQMNMIHQRYHETQATIRPVLDYLEDIRRALSADLTAAGLENVQDVVRKAEANTQQLQAALNLLTDELTTANNRVSSIIAITKTPGASKPGGQTKIATEDWSDSRTESPRAQVTVP